MKKFSVLKLPAIDRIGKCHKYKEYEIKPSHTNILLDNIEVIKSPFFKADIKMTMHMIGANVLNEG